MDNPGVYSLSQNGSTAPFAADLAITTPLTNFDCVEIDDLDGMTAVTLAARLGYGSGGTSVIGVVKTTLDGGTTWIDIARFDFATAGAEKVISLSGLTPRTSPLTVIPLAAEGANDGILGDRLKLTVTTTGTYAGSTVFSVRASVR